MMCHILAPFEVSWTICRLALCSGPGLGLQDLTKNPRLEAGVRQDQEPAADLHRAGVPEVLDVGLDTGCRLCRTRLHHYVGIIIIYVDRGAEEHLIVIWTGAIVSGAQPIFVIAIIRTPIGAAVIRASHPKSDVHVRRRRGSACEKKRNGQCGRADSMSQLHDANSFVVLVSENVRDAAPFPSGMLNVMIFH
jgi:hypothetical protein